MITNERITEILTKDPLEVIPTLLEGSNATSLKDQQLWLHTHIEQHDLLKIYTTLVTFLSSINQFPDGTPECEKADALCDMLDPLWYAMTDATLNELRNQEEVKALFEKNEKAIEDIKQMMLKLAVAPEIKKMLS